MQFALKRLTRSDLTFFEYQFRQQNAGNQKSINLNADVFVDIIFPQARSAAGGHARQFPLPLTIYGPGLRPEPYRITRKIIAAGDRQKNWRLNGEFVRDPDFDPARYHDLAAGDFALFGFDGQGVPVAVAMVLVAAGGAEDAAVHAALDSFLGKRRMAEMGVDALRAVVDQSPPDHPIRELLDAELDVALEEASLGSAEGARRLSKRPSSRRMSGEALAAARARAESIGRDGEIIIDAWLRKKVSEGALKSAVWIAETNAVNAWDFEIEENDGTKVRVEVKSTSGPFERTIHISQAEVEAAAASSTRTDLYRVYAVSDDGAWLQVATNLAPVAGEILKAIGALGDGIVPDGYSIRPISICAWSEAIRLSIEADEEE